jgi:hypothetical protein
MIYTDFVHNVRTGDYVLALLEEAESLNEYAFALGSLRIIRLIITGTY